MQDNLFRRNTRNVIAQCQDGRWLSEELASRNIDPGESIFSVGMLRRQRVIGCRSRTPANGEQVVVLVLVEEALVDQGARSDDASHSTIEAGFGPWRPGELFAHSDETLVLLNERLEMSVEVREREAAHVHTISPLTPRAGGELDVQQGGEDGRLVEV